jgi:hypothetical protein
MPNVYIFDIWGRVAKSWPWIHHLPRLCEYPVLTTHSGGAAAWLNGKDAPKSTKTDPNIYQKTRSAFLVL